MLNKCVACGADIEYSASTQSLKCPYCGTINEIKKPEDSLPDRVELIIPLVSSEDALEKQVYGYMASGDFTPDDMLEAATFIKRECFYVPAYIFTIDYDATWTASFGYDQKEPYRAYRTVNGREESYTAYRTVTDWRPANGIDSGIFSVSTYAGKSLHGVNLSPRDIVPRVIDNSKPTEFNDSFITGVSVDSFSISESNAFEVMSDSVDQNIGRRVQKNAQGDHQRDWNWNARLSHSSQTVYVPICHAIFDYLGTEYHYWADGVSGASIRADKLPEDHERKKLVNQGYWPLIAAIFGYAASIYFWSFSWVGLGVVAAVLAYGALRGNAIIGYSKSIREALLLQMQASASSGKGSSTEEQEKFSKAFQRPQKPFLAETHKDKFVIPILSFVALFLALLPAYLSSSSNKVDMQASIDGSGGTLQDMINQQANDSDKDSQVSPNTDEGSNSDGSTSQPIESQAPVASAPTAEQAPQAVPNAAQAPNLVESQMSALPEGQAQETNAPVVILIPQVAPNPDQESKAVETQNSALPNEGVDNSGSTQSQAGNGSSDLKVMQQNSSQPVSTDDSTDELLRMATNSQWQSVDDLVSHIRQQVTQPPAGDRKVGRVLNREGVSLLKQGNTAASIDAFRRALAASPADIEIENNLAYACLQNGDLAEAEKYLFTVLQRAPERSSAWANLSELYARVGNSAVIKSQAALRLVVYFSQNRQHTVEYLTRTSQSSTNLFYREIAAKVLKEIDSIPSKSSLNQSQDSRVTQSSKQPSSPNSGENIAKEIDSIPSKSSLNHPQDSRVTRSLKQPSSPSSGENIAVESMLASARSALAGKRYQEAITTTKNILSIEPGNAPARQLMKDAKEQQLRDLRNIEIH